MASLDVFLLFRLVVALAAMLWGLALLRWREQIVDSSWPSRWLIGLDERLRRPLEVLYVLIGMVLIVLGAGGLYVLAPQAP
jgi:hypothetical protein